MEFIRYASEDDIKDLKNHASNLSEFIERSSIEKDDPTKYENVVEYDDNWLSNIKVTITIKDV